MSTLSHSLSAGNHFDADDRAAFLDARAASVSTESDPDGYMACCGDLNKLATAAEYEAWLDSLDLGHYPDEAPTDDAIMFDGPLFEADWSDLDHLLGQRAACLSMPETLAELDREIEALRLVLAEGGAA